ncbi:MAG: hypothetical protein M5U25_18825 [Planctomycetota bacterium]|nr:hypothetical protein [Planctomycetota bacterium]
MARRIASADSNDQVTDDAAVSIYTVSRTHGKSLNKWAKILKEIEEQAPYRGQSYAPFRAAVVSLLQGNEEAENLINDGFEQMMASASARWQQRIVRSMWTKSVESFGRFSEELAERFGRVHEVYEQPGNTNYVNFEDVPIKGRFHFSADFDDNQSFVYMVGGAWDVEQTGAFVELLSVIAEEAHDANRQDVLLIDLALQDPLVRPKTNAKRLRKELLNEARNLRRLIRAISQE